VHVKGKEIIDAFRLTLGGGNSLKSLGKHLFSKTKINALKYFVVGIIIFTEM